MSEVTGGQEGSAAPSTDLPVLRLIGTIPPQSRVGVLLRHGEKAAGGTEVDRLLTSEGHREARSLGENLPKGRQVRIWHSPVPRCRQTAEDCLAGYVQANPGADALLMGAEPRLESLSALSLDHRARSELIANAGGPLTFLRAWLDDLLPAGVIHRSADVSHDVAGWIISNLRVAPEGALHLNISHDFTLLALRAHVFRVKLEDLSWAGYLDGIVFELTPQGRVVARWRDLVNEVDVSQGV